MKLHIRFKISSDQGFDITCTHFHFCCCTGYISIWNGIMDSPHLFEASNFISFEYIETNEAGTYFTCYNNISAALKDFNIMEVK